MTARHPANSPPQAATGQDLVRQFLTQRDTLWGYLMALARDSAAAEEIFQETALAVLEEANRGIAIANVAAWTREIARRRALEFFRRRARDRKFAPLDEAWMASVEQAFAENEWTVEELHAREKMLRECLEQLGGRARQVIELRYRGERSMAAIAEKLAWQVESVTVALSRARKALTDCVQQKLRVQEADLR